MDYESRPWGEFHVLEDQPTHKAKRLVVHPGKRLSYQRHKHRAEHWVVVGGIATVTLDDKTFEAPAGTHIHIACGAKHRLANGSAETLTVVEVQTGTYFGEDDIERFEDDFGRS